jgi:hypothetical protein
MVVLCCFGVYHGIHMYTPLWDSHRSPILLVWDLGISRWYSIESLQPGCAVATGATGATRSLDWTSRLFRVVKNLCLRWAGAWDRLRSWKTIEGSFKGMVQTCSTLRICLGKEHFLASYFHVHHGTGVLIQSHYTLHFPLSISFSQVWNHQDLRSG